MFGRHMSRLRRARYLSSGWVPAVAIALASLVLAGIVLLAKQQLRLNVREQITRRDAEVLYAVSQMNQGAGDTGAATIEEPSEQFELMLDISRIKGVIAVRLFNSEGQCLTPFPANVIEQPSLASDHISRLREMQPVSVFRPAVQLDTIFAASGLEGTEPLLEVLVPLHPPEESRLVGIAQFVIEGKSMAAEFAALDRHLNTQALVAFLAGTTILGLGLGWAFHRLQRAHRLLQARGDELAKANEELVLALKTSAVGSVTSHLLHGLKNPLAGLQLFVATRGGGKEGGERWELAEAAARRMNAMIQDVLELLRDQSEGDTCDLSVGDLADLVKRRLDSQRREHGVQVVHEITSERRIVSRNANLVSLILVNLLENAVQATPAGKSVRLRIFDDSHGVCCEVHDEGPGIPPHIEARLFTPGRSSKATGTGLGLALCRQLAKHLGAELVLKANSAAGCVFMLALPEKLLVETGVPADC